MESKGSVSRCNAVQSARFDDVVGSRLSNVEANPIRNGGEKPGWFTMLTTVPRTVSLMLPTIVETGIIELVAKSRFLENTGITGKSSASVSSQFLAAF